ncbi:MAG: GNAT family N-acetyltransferase [Sulfobacillus sp.]
MPRWRGTNIFPIGTSFAVHPPSLSDVLLTRVRAPFQSVATEAGRASWKLGFDNLAMHCVIARMTARNRPSARLVERIGMRLKSPVMRWRR